MNPNTRRQVAASLDATPDLLPCLPDLELATGKLRIVREVGRRVSIDVTQA